DLLELGGDLKLDDIEAVKVAIDVTGGSAAIGRIQTDGLVALVRDEGGSFRVDDLALTGRKKNLVGVLADNTTITVSDDRERAKGIIFDLRGNDGEIGERIEVTGVARKGALF